MPRIAKRPDARKRLPAAKPRRRQADRSEATRAALIRAAIDTVSERGYAGATAAHIAARAKVTRGALQHHFGTIQDLLLEVVRYVSQELVGEIEAELSARDSLDQRIGAIADRYWQVYGGADYFALIEIWMGSRSNDAFRAKIENLMRQITEKRNDYWRALLADYPLTELEVDTMRGALLAVVRGAAVHRMFSQDDARALRQIRFAFARAQEWMENKAPAKRRTKGTRARLIAGA
ncbi:MAG TPA: TetR/AcrR family transcriptional regulator [Xanthobacteraceae bacterium]|jgi:AcrR family transcriptional regulator